MLAVWGLRELAHAQRDAFLLDKARTRLGLISRGATPYRWALRGREDLIAGRVFDAKSIDFDERGLRVQAGAEVFEIGFPLNGDVVDLRRFDSLRLRAFAPSSPIRCELVVRPQITDAERVTPLPLKAQGESEDIPLAGLSWTDASRAGVPAPVRAASLRLRVAAPAGTVFRLDTLELLPDTKLSDPGLLAHSLAAAKQAPPGLTGDADIAAPDTVLPIIEVPPSISNEAALAYFDRVRDHEPSALLIPQMHRDSLQAAASTSKAWPSLVSWSAAGVLGIALLVLRLRPLRQPRLRAGLELAAVVAPALTIVIGGLLGNDLDAPLATVLVFVAVYTFSLPRTAGWNWIGNVRHWLAPGVAVLAALALAAALGDHFTLRGAGSLLRYLAWAALQQYLLCFVVIDRCRLLGLAWHWTMLVVATLFALLHTPNETLMLATFAGGLVWTAAWLRDRAFLPIVSSHVFSAVIVFSALPKDVLRSAEVSLRFLLS